MISSVLKGRTIVLCLKYSKKKGKHKKARKLKQKFKIWQIHQTTDKKAESLCRNVKELSRPLKRNNRRDKKQQKGLK
jgi:hypothetical protein